MINVTKTYLPDREKYKKYIDEIFDSGRVTNNGPLVNKLEERLCSYLGVRNLVLVSNGTAALEIAYRALELKGSVVTTPFSFVATTSSLVTNNIKPVFADIRPDTLNINPEKIEEALTLDTSALVPVHVFGNACEIDAIEAIASKHQLKVIYDAAHAFDVKYKEKNIAEYGDISVLSFHATKLFHTIEGGALVVNDDELVAKVKYLRNFGIKNQAEIPELGTNAKMNEFEAAMGLCVLDDIDKIESERKAVVNYYQENLGNMVSTQLRNKYASSNYAYYPVLFKDERIVEKVQSALNAVNIFPRRYFFPSLDTLHYIDPPQYMPISRDVASRIICLPVFGDINEDVLSLIVEKS